MMRKITKTIKLKDLFYITEVPPHDSMTKLKKQSNNTCFYDTFGQRNDYFLRWKNFWFIVFANIVQPMKNTQFNIQIVTLFLQFSDENTDKGVWKLCVGSRVSYTIRKKCNLDRVSLYYAETLKSKREIGMSNYKESTTVV